MGEIRTWEGNLPPQVVTAPWGEDPVEEEFVDVEISDQWFDASEYTDSDDLDLEAL